MSNENNDFYQDNNNTSSEKLFMPKRWFSSKVLCFLVAFGIWIYAVNVTTQDYEKTFSLIDITVEGWEELLDETNMSVVNLEESKISVTVKGLRSDISKLTPSDFSAYIDISDLQESGKHNLEVSVDLPSTVSLVSKYPESVIISTMGSAKQRPLQPTFSTLKSVPEKAASRPLSTSFAPDAIPHEP